MSNQNDPSSSPASAGDPAAPGAAERDISAEPLGMPGPEGARPKGIFGRARWLFGLILAVAVFSVYAEHRSKTVANAGVADMTAPILIGTALGAILFPIIIGAICFLIFGKSQKAARIGACVVLALVAVSSIGKLTGKADRPQVDAVHPSR